MQLTPEPPRWSTAGVPENLQAAAADALLWLEAISATDATNRERLRCWRHELRRHLGQPTQDHAR